ncbi:MAG: SDR family NAD(P)-dependent oxidoreductase [Proteobacteria bacterium]|nr:SDR family NAD(P)-dependent oxidoreductase [Pseudomonadota bacterium]MDA1012712.1 SDR family NAD(P)-dependent oxidoreductase [Pseudomonadota bacterium]
MISPEGRVVMISGASRGIGLAVARNLYQAGFSLSLGVRNIEAMRKTVEDWDTSRVLISKYDAVDKETHKTWVDTTAERYGRIDGLVNNAGIMQPVSVDDGEFNEKGLDLMWSVNVKAPLSMTCLALPHLRKCGSGRVINVASLAGKAVFGNGVGYSMTKFAAVALSHATRHGGWADGVRCTALCPGYVATDLTSSIETVSLEDMISADDLAELVNTVISLSNTASVAELIVNCRPDIVG